MKRFAWLALWFLPLASFAGIPIQHWTMPTGAKVYLVEAPGIPMVDVEIEFDAGARRDPAGQAGLAVATATMMGKGIKSFQGQPAMDENQLGEAWADLGAMVNANAGNDRMSFSLRSLTRRRRSLARLRRPGRAGRRKCPHSISQLSLRKLQHSQIHSLSTSAGVSARVRLRLQ